MKKTKSSKKIVLKITMSMTLTNFDAFVIFIDSWSYGPLIRWPDRLPYSFFRSEASAGLLFGPLSY